MSVSNTNLIFYGSVNMPESGVGIAGGAIDTATRVIFDNPASGNTLNDTVLFMHTTAPVITGYIVGRKADGTIVSGIAESLGLGVYAVPSPNETYERILKVGLINPQVATQTNVGVYHRQSGLLITIPSGTTTVRRPFYNVSSSPANPTGFYEKVFLKNTHASLALLDVIINEGTGQSAIYTGITFALAITQGDVISVSNRSTAPSGASLFSAFDHNAKTIPGSYLGVGSGVGIWLNLNLASGAAANKTTYELDANGNSI